MDPLSSMPSILPGIQIIEAPWMTDRRQIRFPRSKKRRIQQKWAKDPRNWRSFPKSEIYEIQGGIVFMHPDIAAELRKRLKEAPDGPVVPVVTEEMGRTIIEKSRQCGNSGFLSNFFSQMPPPRPEPVRDEEVKRNFRMFMDVPYMVFDRRPFLLSSVS
jgi:hypothetical protein